MATFIEDVYNALDAQIELIRGAPTNFPGDVVLMNITYVPTTGHPYVIATMAAYVRRAITLGPDSTVRGGYMAEHKGTYRIDAVVPQDAGRTIATRLQDEVLALFPRGTTLIGSGGEQVIIDAPTPLPLSGQAGTNLDAWLWASVNVPWFAYEAA